MAGRLGARPGRGGRSRGGRWGGTEAGYRPGNGPGWHVEVARLGSAQPGVNEAATVGARGGLGAGAAPRRVARAPGNRTRTWRENENASAALGAKWLPETAGTRDGRAWSS